MRKTERTGAECHCLIFRSYAIEEDNHIAQNVIVFPSGERKILSRNLNLLRFTSLKKALAKLPVQNAILDGEIVCLDKEWG